MKRAIGGLIWEMWRRNRPLAGLAPGVMLFAWLLNRWVGASLRASEQGRDWLLTINWVLAVGSFSLVFGFFNYTEFDPQKERHGFPSRLFVLPLPSWLLILVPMSLGLASVELVYFGWMKLVFEPGQILRPVWFAALVGT